MTVSAQLAWTSLPATSRLYLQAQGKGLEEVIYGEGCVNDGLHPADAMQKIMFESVVRTLDI